MRYSAAAFPELEDLPNIGPAIAYDFRMLGITTPRQLKGKNPVRLYEALNKKTRTRQDPCLLDCFMAAVDFVSGAPAKPWWRYTPRRQKLMQGTPLRREGDYRSVVRESPEHRALATKAAREAEKVLPLFERAHPHDKRPRRAIEAIRAWGQGKRKLGMAEVRKLSLDSHAAARAATTDAARFAARAAGHAVATWHVPNHASGVPMYAKKAVAASKERLISG